MIVSADKEMRFYSSPNLKDWTYVSAFGKGYGAQPNQFECPDFFQLAVDGNPNKTKWVMIVNINPGCLFVVVLRSTSLVTSMGRTSSAIATFL